MSSLDTAMDLRAVRAEMAAVPPHSPLPAETAIAVINDCFRSAGKPPMQDDEIAAWRQTWGKLASEQAGIMAHYLRATSLGTLTVAAIARSGADLRPGLRSFFEKIAPLTAEMIRSNSFRQEEALRRWAEWLGIGIAGENPGKSAARLEKLDYRKTLSEFREAEAARKMEEAERARILREAEEKAAAARGWRE